MDGRGWSSEMQEDGFTRGLTSVRENTLQTGTAEGEALKREIVRDVVEALRGMIPELAQELCKLLFNASSRLSSPQQAGLSALPKRTLYLHFNCIFPAEGLLTLTHIQDHEKALVQVELRDGPDGSGSIVKDGPESCILVEIYVFEGDLTIPKSRPGKPQELLKGECRIPMSQGIATASNIAFTDNSKSARESMYRLAARAVSGVPDGVEILDAISDAFRVKERRTKRRTLSLTDSTQCLKHIGDAASHKLAEAKIPASALQKHHTVHEDNDDQSQLDLNICTVQDVLQLHHTKPEVLQKILPLTKSKWSEVLKSAESCSLTDKGYKYDDEEEGVTLHLDCIFKIVQILLKGPASSTVNFEMLDNVHQEKINKMRLAAFVKRKKLQRIVTPCFPAESLSAPSIPCQGASATTPCSLNLSSGQDGCSSMPFQTHQGQVVAPWLYLEQRESRMRLPSNISSPDGNFVQFQSVFDMISDQNLCPAKRAEESSSSFCGVQDFNDRSDLTSPEATKRPRRR